MKVLAIIPARSGSKGLPDKNIIDLLGRPLMDYTIKAAIDSKCFEEVMVSTDSEKYAKIAIDCGANVPFLRSEFTSSDTATSWDVVREVIGNYKRKGKNFDYIALLQPTSPLRTSDDIIRAFRLLDREDVHNVIAVTEVAHPIQWCFPLDKNCSMESFANSPYYQARRQDLEKYYQVNGAIYLVDASKIENPEYNLYKDSCFAYIMPGERSVDIDTEKDLIVVKTFLHIS